jgi:hypothetical protein
VPTYAALAYRDLYPGVDLVYRGTEGRLKSEFVLAPGADPAAIALVYDGVQGLHLREDGALVLQTPLGELVETAPLIYQEVDGLRQEIPGGYVLFDPHPSNRGSRGGFYISAYDPALPLVIDPELAYASYLGGSGNDVGLAIAVDGAGSVYVMGATVSSDFPTTTNAIQPGHGGGPADAFVTKIVSAGGVYTYAYSSYLGGSGNEYGYAIAVDGAGDAYVAGQTTSSDFPTTTNAIQPGYGGSTDAFVTKIVSAGGVYTYAYSSYLGGSGDDRGRGIAVDGAGDAYVVGQTASSDFITTTNAVQPGYGGGSYDAFVTKIVSAGGVYTYAYSSYLGGSGNDEGLAIAVDGAGDAYVAGMTDSSDFFTTTNAIQPGHGGGNDAFVTKIVSADGVYTYAHSSYLGGSGYDVGRGIAVDGPGDAYVVGETRSSDFFTTTNAIQPGHGGGTDDAFVTKIISAGQVYSYGYSTYLGGSGDDAGRGIAVDGAGDAYVAGYTWSSDFITTTNAIQPGHGGGNDAFVIEIAGSGYAAITVTKTANVSLAKVGQTITYTYRITNTGDVYLTGIVAADDRLGPVALGATWLLPGVGTVGTLTYTVVPGDLPGPIANTVTVTGTPPLGADVSATAEESVALRIPAIAVSKWANASSAEVGQTITYTYRVTNTGDVILNPVTAYDDQLGVVTLGATSLAAGAWTTGLLTYTVVLGDLPGPLDNTVTAVGFSPAGIPVFATDDESIALRIPAIAVSKWANVSSAQIGETITYTYRITNTGNVDLTGIVASDDRLGPVPLGATSLAPDAWTTGLLTYTVVPGDLPGPITNTVTVTGTPPAGSPAGDSARFVLALDEYRVYLPLVVRGYP